MSETSELHDPPLRITVEGLRWDGESWERSGNWATFEMHGTDVCMFNQYGSANIICSGISNDYCGPSGNFRNSCANKFTNFLGKPGRLIKKKIWFLTKCT